MPPVTLYAKDAEQDLWQQARETAAANGQSLSDFVAEAVREHLRRSTGSRPAETSLALARLLLDQLEREQTDTKTARKRAPTRRRA